MHSLTHQYEAFDSLVCAQRFIYRLAISGALLLAGAQIANAAPLYKSTEGHTHSANQLGQLGTELVPPLIPNTNDQALKRTLINDNHLTYYRDDGLFFGDDIWITAISTLLYADSDLDGYFSAFSLSVDADTHYSQADVYINIDIQRTDGLRERLHSTDSFNIYGNSLTDEYRIEIELLRNYPIGNYDLFVDLVNANNNDGLPLESDDFDINPAPGVSSAPILGPTTNSDIRVVEHSGASSLWLLIAFAIPAVLRRLKKAKFLQHRNYG